MIYWDNNSTTPCASRVVEAMQPYWLEKFGNPSSPHVFGRRAAEAVEVARRQVAKLVNALSHEIVFTSGATESNNLIFLSLLCTSGLARKRIVVSSIEHKSILEPAALLGERGFEIVHLPVNTRGLVDLDAAERLIDGQTVLVSVQTVNNELGTIQPVAELAEIAHAKGSYFHTDAAQALGKIPFDVEKINCDIASFSAHKMYGPKGVGGLFVRGGPKRWPWTPPFRGGGQESGLRPGTLNVPGIVGFGVTSVMAAEELISSQYDYRAILDKELISLIKSKMPEVTIIAHRSPRVPGVFSATFPDVPGDILVNHIKEVVISNGAACSSGALSPSHVLDAIGCSRDEAKATIRFSFGRLNSNDDYTSFITLLKNAVVDIRTRSTSKEVDCDVF